jgi:hypothetical protein
MAKKKKTPDEGFGLQKPEEPKSAPSPVATEPSAPATHTRHSTGPQPRQPKSVFPPLEVSGLGTVARGQFRERLGFRRSRRSYDGSTVMVVPDEMRRQLESEYPDLRSRPRSPLV